MTGALDGTIDGVPMTVRASGQRVEIAVPFQIRAIRGLWRSRRAGRNALSALPRRRGFWVTVRVGGIPVFRTRFG
ncbi:MAG: hypothetical protein AAGD00_04670 [Planctomycetota bacterium]